jgi:hemolysin activation/secretion protein
MAIALPPPITPQQGPPLELRDQSLTQKVVTIEYKGIHVHVFGSERVSAERIRAAVNAADNISDAVRAVGYLYYVSGYPAALVTYATVGQIQYDVYVRVVPGRVRDVEAPAALMPYFSDLKAAKEPLTSSGFERDRALADAEAERSGLQYKPVFKPVGGDEVVLDLGEAAPGSKQWTVLGTFSNYGNRYAGPYLATAGGRLSFSSGDEFTLTGATSVRVLGLGGSHSEPFHEGDGGWYRVTPLGVFGLQGRYGDFSQTLQGFQFNGEFSSGSATWLYPLYSDFQHRLNLQAKIERDHEDVDAPALSANCTGLVDQLLIDLGLATCPSSPGGEVLSELYNFAELNLSYVARAQHGEHQAELQAGVVVRKGLGPHEAGGSSASLDFFLWQPSFSARYSLAPRWSVLADGNFQFSNSALPQLQQFVLGGPASLHAYEAGAGIGDHGENLRLSVEWKGYDDSWTERYGIRPRGLVEYGSSSLEHSVLGARTGRITLADAGAAVDVRFLSWLGGSLSAAQSFYSRGADISPNGLAKKYVFFQIAAKY